MSEDLTKNLPSSQNEKLTQVLETVQNLDRRVGNIETSLGSIETKVGSMDTRLGTVETKVVSIDTRLESLEGSVAERLFDTRPIWEKVVADIALLQGGLDSLHAETRTGLRDLKRQFSVLNDTFLEVRADYKDLDRRVYHLEEPRS